MKNNLLIVMLLFLTVPLLAQYRSNRDETLFRNGTRSGFFIASLTEFSGFDTDLMRSSGGGFGFVVGDLFLGAYGMGTVSRRHFQHGDRVEFGQGGFWLGYSFPQQEAFHGFASLKAGWGALNLEVDDEDFFYDDSFFALTPEAGIEVNVFRLFRIAGSVGYRFMNELSDTPAANLEDYKGLTGTLTLRFGCFGRQRR